MNEENNNINESNEINNNSNINLAVDNHLVDSNQSGEFSPTLEIKPTKNNKKILAIIGIILIILIAFGFIFKNKIFIKNDVNKKEEILSNTNFYLNCYDKDGNEIDDVDAGDSIYCRFGFDTSDNFKVKTLNFNLDYNDDLEISSNDKSFTIADHKAIVTFVSKSKNNYVDFNFIVNDSMVGEINIEISNISLELSDNLNYDVNDLNFTFTTYVVSDIYYIYDSNTVIYNNYYKVSTENKSNYLDIYKCHSDECEYYLNGKFIIFKDGDDYILKDISHSKENNITIPNEYFISHLVADDISAYGVILTKNSQKDSSDPDRFYYSFKNSKISIEADGIEAIYSEDGHRLIGDGILYSLDGELYVPSKTEIKKIEGTNISYYSYIDDYFYFYDSNSNIITGKIVEYDNYATMDGNLIINDIENSMFYVYDKNGNSIKTSKKYDSIKLCKNDYKNYSFAVVNENGVIKLVDFNDNVLAKFDAFKSDDLDYYYSGDDSIIFYIQKYGKTIEYTYNYLNGKLEKDICEDELYAEKPILYLYPTKDNTKVSVNFAHEDLLTTTYPKFINSWNVTANKNGDLYDNDGKYYYGLYWEERISHNVDFSEGFYVTKDNAIDFLEEKLTIIGLTDKEKNEFIMYWLPVLEKNGKNLVYFELTEERQSYNKLEISPKPDSLLRVAIHVKKVDKKTNIKEEKLTTFKRVGFAAVEWGGVNHK